MFFIYAHRNRLFDKSRVFIISSLHYALKTILSVCLLFLIDTCLCQPIYQTIYITQGDLNFLKGQTEIKIEFDYEDIAIVNGGTEKEFKARKVEYLNKKGAGRGDKWERSWNQYRLDYFEPNFKKAFEAHSMFGLNNDTCRYVLIFKTLRFYDEALLTPPDEEAEPEKKPAFADAQAWIVERQNPEKVLVQIVMQNIPGNLSGNYRSFYSGSTATALIYDVRVRLSLVYTEAGKSLGAFIANKISKRK